MRTPPEVRTFTRPAEEKLVATTPIGCPANDPSTEDD